MNIFVTILTMVIMHGFLAAGILQSLDAGKPVSRNTTADKQNADEEISSEDDTESDNFLSTPILLNYIKMIF